MLNKSTVSTVQNFLNAFAKSIDFSLGKPLLIYHENTVKLLEKYRQQIDLTEFYKLINCIFILKNLQSSDLAILKQFQNCVSLRIQFEDQKPDYDLNRYLKVLPNVKSIHVYNSDQCVPWSNNGLLDKISNGIRIEALIIESPSKIDLSFILSNLPRLKFLQLALFHSIPSSLIFDFIKNLKNMEVLDVSFVKPNTLHRKDLSAFKK